MPPGGIYETKQTAQKKQTNKQKPRAPMVNQFSPKQPRIYNVERRVFSINNAGKTGQPYAKQ